MTKIQTTAAALAACVLSVAPASAQTTYRVSDTAPGGVCPGGTIASAATQFPEFAPFDVNGDGTVCTQIVQAAPSVTPDQGGGFRGGLGGSGTAVAGALVGLVVIGAIGGSGGSSGGS